MDETNPITQIDFMQEHIEALQNQLAEKDAMIDWLVNILSGICQKDDDVGCGYICPIPGKLCYEINTNDWRKAAQEVVKKNGREK